MLLMTWIPISTEHRPFQLVLVCSFHCLPVPHLWHAHCLLFCPFWVWQFALLASQKLLCFLFLFTSNFFCQSCSALHKNSSFGHTSNGSFQVVHQLQVCCEGWWQMPLVQSNECRQPFQCNFQVRCFRSTSYLLVLSIQLCCLMLHLSECQLHVLPP